MYLLLDKIVQQLSMDNIDKQLIVEIGPGKQYLLNIISKYVIGPGCLTRSMLNHSANIPNILAIEKDKRFEPILQQLSQLSQGRLKYLIGDAQILLSKPSFIQKFCHENFSFSWPPSKIQLVGNLPFQIATVLLIQWLHMMNSSEDNNVNWIGNPDIDVVLTLMFQRELAERITFPLSSTKSSTTIGRLTFIAQFMCETKLLFHVDKNQFCPKPKVDASVIQLVKKNFEYQKNISLKDLEYACKFLFAERRKTINTLLKRLPKYDSIIKNIDYNIISILDKRPEQLNMDQMISLAKLLI